MDHNNGKGKRISPLGEHLLFRFKCSFLYGMGFFFKYLIISSTANRYGYRREAVDVSLYKANKEIPNRV